MHLLVNTVSLSFTCLFRIKWDNFCWQSNKCISSPCLLLQLNHTPPKHHRHLRTTNPLQNCRFKPLGREGPTLCLCTSQPLSVSRTRHTVGCWWIRLLHNDWIWFTNSNLSPAMQMPEHSHCKHWLAQTQLTELQSNQGLALLLQLLHCKKYWSGGSRCTSSSEWMEQVFHLVQRVAGYVTNRTVPMSTGVREGLWNALGQDHTGGTSHLFPGQRPSSSLPNYVSWRKGPSLTACVITASLQWGASQEQSCLQQKAGSWNTSLC